MKMIKTLKEFLNEFNDMIHKPRYVTVRTRYDENDECVQYASVYLPDVIERIGSEIDGEIRPSHILFLSIYLGLIKDELAYSVENKETDELNTYPYEFEPTVKLYDVPLVNLWDYGTYNVNFPIYNMIRVFKKMQEMISTNAYYHPMDMYDVLYHIEEKIKNIIDFKDTDDDEDYFDYKKLIEKPDIEEFTTYDIEALSVFAQLYSDRDVCIDKWNTEIGRYMHNKPSIFPECKEDQYFTKSVYASLIMLGIDPFIFYHKSGLPDLEFAQENPYCHIYGPTFYHYDKPPVTSIQKMIASPKIHEKYFWKYMNMATVNSNMSISEYNLDAMDTFFACMGLPGLISHEAYEYRNLYAADSSDKERFICSFMDKAICKPKFQMPYVNVEEILTKEREYSTPSAAFLQEVLIDYLLKLEPEKEPYGLDPDACIYWMKTLFDYNKYNTNKKSFLKLQADDFIIMGFRYMQWLIVNRKDDSPSGFILFSIRFAYLLYSYYDIHNIQFQQIIQHLMRHHDSQRVYHFALFLIFAYSTGNGISISTKYPEKLDVFNHYDIRLDYYSKIFQEWNLHDVYYMMGGFMTLSTPTIPLVSVLPKVNCVTPLRLPAFNVTTIVSTIMQATQLVDSEFHELMKTPEEKK